MHLFRADARVSIRVHNEPVNICCRDLFRNYFKRISLDSQRGDFSKICTQLLWSAIFAMLRILNAHK